MSLALDICMEFANGTDDIRGRVMSCNEAGEVIYQTYYNANCDGEPYESGPIGDFDGEGQEFIGTCVHEYTCNAVIYQITDLANKTCAEEDDAELYEKNALAVGVCNFFFLDEFNALGYVEKCTDDGVLTRYYNASDCTG
eukprot:430431_1